MSKRDQIRLEMNRVDEAKIEEYRKEIARIQELIEELKEDIDFRNSRMGTN